MIKFYLTSNVIPATTQGEKEKTLSYFDIGKTFSDRNSYRVWVNMFTPRDDKGQYVAFPLKDAALAQGKARSTLIVKRARGNNIFHFKKPQGNWYLDTSAQFWRYYDGANEGIFISTPNESVDIYVENKDDSTNRKVISINIHGFEEDASVDSYDVARKVADKVIASMQGGNR